MPHHRRARRACGAAGDPHERRGGHIDQAALSRSPIRRRHEIQPGMGIRSGQYAAQRDAAYLSQHQYGNERVSADAPGAGRSRSRRATAALLAALWRYADRTHATDPRHFLQATHDFPTLEKIVLREPGLRLTLRRLPGRKIVFSNAPVHYASAVIDALGIADL